MTDRQRALDAVRPRGRTGVEIGPLNRPLILREDGDVLYADHCSAEALARKYFGHDTVGVLRTEPIVDVDLILDGCTLAEALGPRAPVDYVVASHVFEHIPDAIGWLREIGSVLREDGTVFLAVPDKRFTFDFRRAPSTTGDLVAHHIAAARVESPAQVFEHAARTVKADMPAIWAGHGREPPPLFGNQLTDALALARKVAADGHYVDAHCTVYTPCSFLAVFREIIELDLIPFEVAGIAPTSLNQLEFFVTLRKRATVSPVERAGATPRLDPRLHHDLPEAPLPKDWRTRLALAWRVLRTGSTRAGGSEAHP
ncbi:methyltransferase domain-containing protein [Methylobacterium trifolii]